MSRRNDRARAAALAIVATDRGAPGPAALARRYLDLPTDTAGVQCRMVIEAGPLHGLTLDQRQRDAAAELANLWREALPGMELPGAFAGGGHAGRHLSPDEEQAAGNAYRAYREAITAVQWATGVRGVIALETAIIHHQRLHYSAHLHGALNALADHMERNG